MPVPRRDFMKLLGISLGSLLLARCQRTGTPEESTFVTCYDMVMNTPARMTPTPKTAGARERIRLCWLRFGELAQKTRDSWPQGNGGGEENPLGTQMTADHRSALDELTAAGELAAPVADLIQEAYAAAVFHVWRSNAPMTCYIGIMVDYVPASADNLVRQSEILCQIAAGSTITPETLEKARTALEHDLAFYSLTDADVQALYDRLLEEYRSAGETLPSFENVELTLTPEIKQAAQFLVEVLMG